MKHATAKFNQSGMHAVCHAAASPFDGRANDRRIRRPLIRLLGMALAWLVLGGCGMQPPVSTAVPANPTPTRHPSPTLPVTPPAQTQAPHTQTAADAEEAGTITHIQLEINGVHFTATLADTEAAQALATLLTAGPLTVEAHDYGGFEKVGALGTALPASDAATSTEAGDIVLYQGDQIVLFYGANSWSYTRLARIDDLTGWADALGGGDVTVTLSLAT